jgi:hypothetical protein
MRDAQGAGRRKYGRVVLTGIAVCGLAGKAAAGEFAYGLGYFLEHSNNIALVPENGQHEWVHSLLVGMAFRDQGPNLATHLAAQTQLNRYQERTFDDTFFSSVDASTVWAIAPQRLTWSLEDRYSEALINPAATDTPSNMVGANIVDTGPDYFMHLGSVNTVVIGGRYGRLTFRGTNVDNNRIADHVRWLYQADSNTIVSVNVEGLKVVFDDDVANTNYKRTDSFLRYDVRPSRSHIIIDLGGTRIDREHGASADGSLVRLTLSRQVTSESSFSAAASREFSDAGLQLQSTITSPTPNPMSNATPGEPDLPLTQDSVTGDVYYAQRFDMSYVYLGGQWGCTVQGFARHYDYELTPQDRRETGGRLDISFASGAQLVPALFGELVKMRYLNTAREDENRSVGVRMSERISRSLTLSLEGRRNSRQSTDPNADYVDRRVLFGVVYSSNPSQYSPVRR